jgi:hypothetical protein
VTRGGGDPARLARRQVVFVQQEVILKRAAFERGVVLMAG